MCLRILLWFNENLIKFNMKHKNIIFVEVLSTCVTDKQTKYSVKQIFSSYNIANIKFTNNFIFFIVEKYLLCLSIIESSSKLLDFILHSKWYFNILKHGKNQTTKSKYNVNDVIFSFVVIWSWISSQYFSFLMIFNINYLLIHIMFLHSY
jgi:hypothetical protein